MSQRFSTLFTTFQWENRRKTTIKTNLTIFSVLVCVFWPGNWFNYVLFATIFSSYFKHLPKELPMYFNPVNAGFHLNDPLLTKFIKYFISQLQRKNVKENTNTPSRNCHKSAKLVSTNFRLVYVWTHKKYFNTKKSLKFRPELTKDIYESI